MAVGGGIGGIILVVVVTLLSGGDFGDVLEQVGGSGGGGGMIPQQTQQNPQQQAADDELAQFVKVVLAETEDVWNVQMPKQINVEYQEPQLVLFSGAVRSGCGSASSATGPFYCPADRTIYIDLSFYRQLRDQLNAPGDFAMAYVIAHEVGHHIQNILGYTDKMQQARGRVSETEYNQMSVKLELMADFLAGAWAHHMQKDDGLLEEGDIEEALNAANAIGDDRLQKRAGGTVVPDSFTHGTSAQRVRWFRKGWNTGDLNQGDTFNAPSL
jgi:predicted metalloprotease